MKLILAVLLAAGLSSAASADDLSGRLGVGGDIGVAFPVGSKALTDANNAGLGLGAWGAYGLSPRWLARVSYDNLQMSRALIQPLELGAAYLLLPGSAWNPSLRGGIGPWFQRGVTTSSRNTVFGFGLGLGVDKFLAERFSVGAALDWFASLKQGSETAGAHVLRLGLNAGWWFGGGKAGSAAAAEPAPSPTVGLSLSPQSAELASGGTQRFEAAVTGASDKSVAWSLDPKVGEISPEGVYTAPNPVRAAQTVNVTATSSADASKKASAQVRLTPPAPVQVASLSPQSAELASGGTQRFEAVVTGASDKSVAWSIYPKVGEISPEGVYTAPNPVQIAQTVNVTATSNADASKKASAQVRLTPPAPVQVASLSPQSAELASGGTQRFEAVVTGASDKSVAWSLDPKVGEISPEGVYTAPNPIQIAQTVNVTATSNADASKKASAQVRLKAPQTVQIGLDIEFESGKAVVKPEYDAQLAKVADFMKKYPATRAEIEGHTDDVGKPDYNRSLSQKRADAVRQALVDRFQIDGSRLTAKGYGPDKPVADNATAEGRAKNRRVVATLSAVQ